MQFRFITNTTHKTIPVARGFTIVEMMVALALFTVVMTIATGAFLSLIGGSGKLQGEATVMTSLNFVMDSMTREIRTGTHYYCKADAELTLNDLTSTQNCTNGVDTLSFLESGASLSDGSTSGRITYYVDSTSGTKKLMRQIGYSGVNTPQSMLSSDVTLKSLQFFVSGTGLSDARQPTVTVIIEAQDPNESNGKVYTLETTVTQRELDI
jgi:prepilin-type N-terminal cleavage/methylation domain-containing protein